MKRYFTPVVVAAAAVSLLLAGGTALAQQKAGQGGMGRSDDTPFESIDTNGDGRLSQDEVKAWAEGVFGAMDSDSNGSLTQEEYMAVRMGPGAGSAGNKAREATMQAAKAERFKAMDTDHNGAVSHDEFMANAEKRFAAAGGGKGGVMRKNWLKTE